MGRTFASGVAIAVLVGASVRLLGQPQPEKPFAFEVATIKENTKLSDGGTMALRSAGGALTGEHLSARTYVSIAFDLEQYQLAGAPSWMATMYYDIQAKPAGSPTRDERLRMLQSLLRDRFHLQSHRRSQQLDGYALVVTHAGQLGPNLQRSSVDCEKAFATTPRCRERILNSKGILKEVGMPLYVLVRAIVYQVQAPVLDSTELAGTFDIDLHWSPDLTTNDDAPSMFTALQEQLGLKLERKRIPTEMFVIDHVERPTLD